MHRWSKAVWFTGILLLPYFTAIAQDEMRPEPAQEKMNLLFYTRLIRNANGQIRMDQSVVSNFRLVPWLKLELGLRHGERPGKFMAYDNYKAELQTKSFFKTVRFVARVSDRINDYPKPTYTDTNYLLIAEGKVSISHAFTALVAAGNVWTRHRDNTTDGLPATQGVKDSFFTYKLGLRYTLRNKGFFEATAGSYDVFNPYLLDSPFMQLSFDHEMSRRWTFYSYFRHQYDWHTGATLNDFLGLGARLHFFK